MLFTLAKILLVLPGTLLTPTYSASREIKGGETHAYEIPLKRGQVLLATADQHGADVIVETRDPNGKLLQTIDSPNGTEGPEPIALIAEADGTYQVIVKTETKDDPKGSYTMRVDGVLSLNEYAKQFAQQQLQSPKMLQLWGDYHSQGPSAADTFYESLKGKGPLLEPIEGDPTQEWMTLIYKGDKTTRAVQAVGGPMTSRGLTPLQRFESSDLWFATINVSTGARFTYAFMVDSEEPLAPGIAGSPTRVVTAKHEDALNPLKYVNSSSYEELPSAEPQPFIVADPKVAKGEIHQDKIASLMLGQGRAFSVYTPPGYVKGGRDLPLLLVFDGVVYGPNEGALVPTPTILDNMIAQGKIPPIAAVFVAQNNRKTDLSCNDKFTSFLTSELLPKIRSEYGAGKTAQSTIVAGSSLGGLAAMYCGFTHPEVFGNVLSQSGSYWFSPDSWDRLGKAQLLPPGFLLSKFASSPKLPIKVYMEVGKLEVPGSMVEPNRHLRDILTFKGYDVTYSEFDGAHDYICWRGTISKGLMALLGKGS